MLKKIIALTIFLFWVVNTFTLAENFSIKTENYGDYISQWKNWDFSEESEYVKIYDATTSSVRFNTESVDVDWMNFEFSAPEGKNFKKETLYTPAKRNAFRGSFAGIDISWDGRGCNKVLGSFYVHEYKIKGNTLQKAAIDFVQYCEWNKKKPLYGSIRYNSDIENACNNDWCDKVREILNIKKNTKTKTKREWIKKENTSKTKNSNIVLSDEELAKAIKDKAEHELKKIKKQIKTMTRKEREQAFEVATKHVVVTFRRDVEVFLPLLYEKCVMTEIGLVGDAPKGKYINANACGPQNKKMLNKIEIILEALLGKRNSSDSRISEEDIIKFRSFKERMTKQLVMMITILKKNNKLSEEVEIGISTIAYVLDVVDLGFIHQELEDFFEIETP